MLKHLIKILANRGKSALINMVIEVLLESLSEFKRASRDGVFDVHKDLHKSVDPEPSALSKFQTFINKEKNY